MSTKYYLITAAQNSTAVHLPFWRNLLAYQKWLGAELLVGRFVYNVCRPERKVADAAVRTDAVYAPQIPIQPQKRRQLAPGLVWCPEMNMLPTAVRPLSGLGTYGQGSSAIFPHAKLAMESIPTGRDERTNFTYTTGACTLPNYIQKKAGLKAAFHHRQAALIVEVAADGRWWVRQISASKRGKIYDLTICVDKGIVTNGHTVRAISWGDIHAAEIDPVVEQVNWGRGGVLDRLKPYYQFMHDTLAWNSASHHDAKSFIRRWKRDKDGISVERELDITAQFLRRANRDWCKMVVVSSNHDRHPLRWLDESNPRPDLINAEIFYEATLARMRDARNRESFSPFDWSFLEWAMKSRLGRQQPKFLGINESFILDGVEYGWHGDLGVNGSRGSTKGLSQASRRSTKGHNHQAEIIDGCYSGAVCNTSMPYANGPGSWSVSHVFHYQNGKRAIITCYGADPWAGFSR